MWLKTEPRIKVKNNKFLCTVHMPKWPVVKEQLNRIGPRIYVLFAFKLDNKFESLKPEHWRLEKGVLGSNWFDGEEIGSVYGKVSANSKLSRERTDKHTATDCTTRATKWSVECRYHRVFKVIDKRWAGAQVLTDDRMRQVSGIGMKRS